MPYLHLEYTSNIKEKIDAKELFHPIHNILAKELGANIKFCQSRALRLDHYMIGDGDEDYAFIHLSIHLKEGRTPAMLKAAGEQTLDWLKTYFSRSEKELLLQIGVNVVPFSDSLYFKVELP